MKALIVLVAETLWEAWYPTGPDGTRKVKISAGGLALAIVVIVGVSMWWDVRALRAEVAEVKTVSSDIWKALVMRGLADGKPAAATGRAALGPSLIPSAGAAEVP